MLELKRINRIILSAGHGGLAGEEFDPGATANGSTENQECRQIVNRLALKLTELKLVVVVLPDYGLKKTIQVLNKQFSATTDWAIEIHKDSNANFSKQTMAKRAGIYYHPSKHESKTVAERMAGYFKLYGANRNSWSRPDNYSNFKSLAWIRQPRMLSHLVECGFMQDELDDYVDEFYASMIAYAIKKCLGSNSK